MHSNHVLSSKRTIALGHVAAGSSTQTSAIVDIRNFQSFVIHALLGTLTTGQTKGVLKVQVGNLANGSDMADLAGATLTVNDTAAGFAEVMEIFRLAAVGASNNTAGPSIQATAQYMQVVFTRNSQAAEILSIYVELCGSRKPPESDDALTVDQTLLVVDPEYVTSGVTTNTTTYGTSTTQLVQTVRTTS